MAEKPWAGRFRQNINQLVEDYSASIAFDKRLYRQDIEGSIAHAGMLASTGLLSEEESAAIISGLKKIREDIENGSFEFDPALEDVHMNIEVELTRRIGEAGKKLHTARSRNDQVATDLRMYVRDEIRSIKALLMDFLQTITEKAEAHVDILVPGMTHLQHAQPISFAHHLLAYFEMFYRDYQRFSDTFARVNVSPLGSAALAGTPHPVDRFMTASALGFDAPSRNSIDAVSDRDFVLEVVFAAALVMMHLSRLAEEIILWNSQEFAFIELPDAYCTGSSIMPQKKNPDVAELVRGKVGSVYGNLVSLLTMMKGLPLAYNRDMQEDKVPLFTTIDTLKASLEVMRGLMDGLSIKTDVLEKLLQAGFITATDIADYLVEKGLPFRDAHQITGNLVVHLEHQGKQLDQTSLDEFKKFSDMFAQDIFTYISPQNSVDRRTSYGGTARNNVRESLREASRILGSLKDEK
ncbi:MAG: argininosuccinate lyase [Deltaproteobacteria bacterium]|nr:argininosuccinate lyase [Deltaproteobacteria bacterium]